MAIGEMMNNGNGTVTGWIADADFDIDIFLDRIESDSPDAPQFQVMTKSPRGRDVPLGPIWQRTAKETGEIYFGGYIQSKATGFMPLRLLQSRRKPGVWNVVRKGQQRRQAEAKEAAALPKQTVKRAPKQAKPATD